MAGKAGRATPALSMPVSWGLWMPSEDLLTYQSPKMWMASVFLPRAVRYQEQSAIPRELAAPSLFGQVSQMPLSVGSYPLSCDASFNGSYKVEVIWLF